VPIKFHSQEIDFPEIQIDVLILWLNNMAQLHAVKIGKINYIFTSDQVILKVNQDFLSHDYYTDVITFDYSKLPLVSGDVFISLDTVRSNALDLNVDFIHELYRVIVHGLLHLTGQNDKLPQDALVMRHKEEIALIELQKILSNNLD